MATPEAEQRSGKPLGWPTRVAEVKAVMMDAALDRATREAKTAEINAGTRTRWNGQKRRQMYGWQVTRRVHSPRQGKSQGSGSAPAPRESKRVLRDGLEVLDTFCSDILSPSP